MTPKAAHTADVTAGPDVAGPEPAIPPGVVGEVPAGPAWNEQLNLLLQSTGEGIYGIDLNGCCTFINRAGAQMLGWRTEQVLGRHMHALIHHTHSDGSAYPEADCPILKAFRQGLPCRIDSEVLWRADGSHFSAEYSSYPIIDHGVVQGAVVTMVDITERKRAEALLQQSHEQLERRVEARTGELTHALASLRELSAYLESVREDERTRIAREIHDELGSLLVALKMDVDWLAKRVGEAPELRSKCHGMGRLIDTAVGNLGRIITDLRPSILDHQGLWAALEWHAQEFTDAHAEGRGLEADVQFHVAADVQAPSGAQGERWAIAVFRIFQEMLSNVARHASARHLRIRLYVDGPPQPVLHLEVRDDGIGAERDAIESRRSYGVMGMRERAGHFGGSLTIDSVPQHGTVVRLVMPFPADTAVAAGEEAPP